MSKWLIGVAALCGVAYLATGVYTVAEDEVAVVRRFGRVILPLSEPGLHAGLPWGFDRVQRVRPVEVKETVIGVAGASDRLLGSSQFSQYLTGDQNLVVIRTNVQYVVADPVRYLFRVADPDRLVARAAEAAVSESVAQESIDAVLTTGKARLVDSIRRRIEATLAECDMGVSVGQVSLPEIVPPAEVKDAFDAVNRARITSQNTVLDAQRYANQTLLEAASTRQATLQQSHADATAVAQAARGEATRFNELLSSYTHNPALARSELYFKMIRDVLPAFRAKLLVDDGTGVDLSILRENP